jgi:hypothetical protein
VRSEWGEFTGVIEDIGEKRFLESVGLCLPMLIP